MNDRVFTRLLEEGFVMGSGFHREPPEWFEASRAAGEPVVMFALNWSDDPDHVCHVWYADCPREDPHFVYECGVMQ